LLSFPSILNVTVTAKAEATEANDLVTSIAAQTDPENLVLTTAIIYNLVTGSARRALNFAVNAMYE
jgi:hypothetical protein